MWIVAVSLGHSVSRTGSVENLPYLSVVPGAVVRWVWSVLVLLTAKRVRVHFVSSVAVSRRSVAGMRIVCCRTNRVVRNTDVSLIAKVMWIVGAVNSVQTVVVHHGRSVKVMPTV